MALFDVNNIDSNFVGQNKNPVVVATGVNSIAAGHNVHTSGNLSLTVGYDARVTGNQSVLIGNKARVTKSKSVAVGYQVYAYGGSSVAIGSTATASGAGSMCIGYGSNATQNDCVAIGRGTSIDPSTTSASSIAIGDYAYVKGGTTTNSIAIGNGAYVKGSTGTSNIVIGDGANTGGTGTQKNNVIIGSAAFLADTSYNVVIGNAAWSGYETSIVIGKSALGYGADSIQIGTSAYSYANGIAIGKATKTQAYSIAIGYGAAAVGGYRNVAIGRGAVVNGSIEQSIAIGYNAYNNIARTSVMSAVPIGRKSGGTPTDASRFNDFVTQEVYLITDEDDFAGASGTINITIPTGASFFCNEVGVMVSTFGSQSAQPEIEWGTDTGLYFKRAITMTDLTALGKRANYTADSEGDNLVAVTGGNNLQARLTTSGTGTTYKGRYYFKGLLVENQ